jgi:hypothetical protein
LPADARVVLESGKNKTILHFFLITFSKFEHCVVSLLTNDDTPSTQADMTQMPPLKNFKKLFITLKN